MSTMPSSMQRLAGKKMILSPFLHSVITTTFGPVGPKSFCGAVKPKTTTATTLLRKRHGGKRTAEKKAAALAKEDSEEGGRKSGAHSTSVVPPVAHLNVLKPNPYESYTPYEEKDLGWCTGPSDTTPAFLFPVSSPHLKEMPMFAAEVTKGKELEDRLGEERWTINNGNLVGGCFEKGGVLLRGEVRDLLAIDTLTDKNLEANGLYLCESFVALGGRELGNVSRQSPGGLDSDSDLYKAPITEEEKDSLRQRTKNTSVQTPAVLKFWNDPWMVWCVDGPRPEPGVGRSPSSMFDKKHLDLEPELSLHDIFQAMQAAGEDNYTLPKDQRSAIISAALDSMTCSNVLRSQTLQQSLGFFACCMMSMTDSSHSVVLPLSATQIEPNSHCSLGNLFSGTCHSHQSCGSRVSR
ncbi:unnamed protein product [Amoebophrya sp. A120]|nr:unnamed protein product [Amoebophrya sp. A120]|eukprot:GSA120T00009835001.1